MSAVESSGGPYYVPYGDGARILHDVGLADAERVFDDPRVRVWRALDGRENATLDATLSDGRPIRLHVKRYIKPARGGGASPAEAETMAVRALERAGIPTLPLVACGRLDDGRSFVITQDLTGYDAADKLIESRAISFDALLEPTADLAARLHDAGLHHRDLYLCHFFARMDAGRVADLRLIDVARVGRLDGLFARRWVVKDLAQFWFSTLALSSVADAQRERWLARYAERRGLTAQQRERLRRSIARKVRSIARHDAKLRRAQPNRNISIPG